MLAALDAPPVALVVMDRGIATEDRLQWLRAQGYRYLVASRRARPALRTRGGAAHRDRLEARRATAQGAQVIRIRLRQAGEHASWNTLRRILEGRQRITATFRRADGRTVHVRKAMCADPPQQAIYDALGIDCAPGGTRKTVVQPILEYAPVVPLAVCVHHDCMM